MLAFAMTAIIRHRANAVPLKKRYRASGRNIAPDPLADAGSPAHRHEARTTLHPNRLRHRVVTVALPCKTWPIVHPSIQRKILHHQMSGLNKLFTLFTLPLVHGHQRQGLQVGL